VALRKAFRLVSGIALLTVGILGLILPVMPGWIFVIPGLLILGDYFPPVRRLLDWAKRRAERAGLGFTGAPPGESSSGRDRPPPDPPGPAV
jgi:hypothetical protein